MKQMSRHLALLGAALVMFTLFAASLAAAASSTPDSAPAVVQLANAPQAPQAEAAKPPALEQTSKGKCAAGAGEIFAPLPELRQPQPAGCVQYSTRQECQDLCSCAPNCKRTCIQAQCCCTCF